MSSIVHCQSNDSLDEALNGGRTLFDYGQQSMPNYLGRNDIVSKVIDFSLCRLCISADTRSVVWDKEPAFIPFTDVHKIMHIYCTSIYT